MAGLGGDESGVAGGAEDGCRQIRAFAEQQLPKAWSKSSMAGLKTGQLVRPLDRWVLCAGRAASAAFDAADDGDSGAGGGGGADRGGFAEACGGDAGCGTCLA